MTTKYDGTCQACFRVQALAKNVLVHHGYTRPGHGYISGDCAGVGHAPYELSCDLTRRWADSSRARLEGWRAELARWEADTIDTRHIVIQQFRPCLGGASPPGEGWVLTQVKRAREWRRTNSFDVTRDHVPSATRGEKEGVRGLSKGHDFAYYRIQRMRELEQWINAVSNEITLLDIRVRQWVHAPEKLHMRNGPKGAPVVG